MHTPHRHGAAQMDGLVIPLDFFRTQLTSICDEIFNHCQPHTQEKLLQAQRGLMAILDTMELGEPQGGSIRKAYTPSSRQASHHTPSRQASMDKIGSRMHIQYNNHNPSRQLSQRSLMKEVSSSSLLSKSATKGSGPIANRDLAIERELAMEMGVSISARTPTPKLSTPKAAGAAGRARWDAALSRGKASPRGASMESVDQWRLGSTDSISSSISSKYGSVSKTGSHRKKRSQELSAEAVADADGSHKSGKFVINAHAARAVNIMKKRVQQSGWGTNRNSSGSAGNRGSIDRTASNRSSTPISVSRQNSSRVNSNNSTLSNSKFGGGRRGSLGMRGRRMSVEMKWEEMEENDRILAKMTRIESSQNLRNSSPAVNRSSVMFNRSSGPSILSESINVAAAAATALAAAASSSSSKIAQKRQASTNAVVPIRSETSGSLYEPPTTPQKSPGLKFQEQRPEPVVIGGVASPAREPRHLATSFEDGDAGVGADDGEQANDTTVRWQIQSNEDLQRTASGAINKSERRMVRRKIDGGGGDRADQSSGCVSLATQKCTNVLTVINPDSRGYFLWNFTVLIFVIYSAVFVPLRLAFNMETKGFFKIWSYTMEVFFITDILISFHTGYHDYQSGNIITDLKKIRTRYIRGWLLIDILSSIPAEFLTDYVIASNDSGSGSNQLAMVKILRIFKILRLFRLVNLKALKDFEYSGWLPPRSSEYSNL